MGIVATATNNIDCIKDHVIANRQITADITFELPYSHKTGLLHKILIWKLPDVDIFHAKKQTYQWNHVDNIICFKNKSLINVSLTNAP